MSGASSAVGVAGHRPRSVLVTVVLLGFLGLSALPSGIDLARGGWLADSLPAGWLDRLPLIESWLVPGLVLGIGFGVGSLVTAYGMATRRGWAWLTRALRWTRHHWSWSAAVALGSGQLAWIALELIYLPGWSWLHVIYGGTGAALVVLPLLPAGRAYLSLSDR